MVDGPNRKDPWRVSRQEMRDLLEVYERLVAEDFKPLLELTDLERYLLGDKELLERLSCYRKAKEANHALIQKIVEDLPLPPELEPHPRPVARPLMEVRYPDIAGGGKFLPQFSYGTVATLFLHIMRDWSSTHEHVGGSTYGPVVREAKKALPNGGELLLPGAGLCRLALELANAGFRVEANDASRVLLTAADWLLNRGPVDMPFYPLAHLFKENATLNDQYMEVKVPGKTPAVLADRTTGDGKGPAFHIVPGDFIQLYSPSGPCHRKFDCIVTCFFLDVLVDLAVFIACISSLLQEGGVWINIGPLNWNKEAKMKLSWKEIVGMFTRAGFDFTLQESQDCDYHMPKGMKMYQETYICAFTVAVRRARLQPDSAYKDGAAGRGTFASEAAAVPPASQPAVVDSACGSEPLGEKGVASAKADGAPEPEAAGSRAEEEKDGAGGSAPREKKKGRGKKR